MGTASAMPISDRNPSAQMLNAHGRLFLIDCAEGTQQQIRRNKLSFLKIEAVFISHIHGDHVFGIFGLLSTMAMYGRTAELHIYAPQSFSSILRFYIAYYGDEINYEIIHHPLKMKEPEVVHESKHIKVSAFPLKHKIECFGFRFDYGNHSYAYCSDTAPFDSLKEWVKGVDLLYHEATYPVAYADKAAARYHSTTEDAARCALEAGVGRLIIGHYSSRERNTDVYEQECRRIFEESVAAQDGDVFEIA